MTRAPAFVVIAAALLAGLAAVSCGGQSEEPGRESSIIGLAQEGKETPATGGHEDSLEGVPIYPGAEKITSGEGAGFDMPIEMLSVPKRLEDYANIRFSMYECDEPARAVFDWYVKEMNDWKQEGQSFAVAAGVDQAGMGAWTKDGGKTAAWVLVGEEEEVTSLIILVGAE
jgi:hypothetical protein